MPYVPGTGVLVPIYDAGTGFWVDVAISGDGLEATTLDAGSFLYMSYDGGETWDARNGTTPGTEVWSSGA